MIKKFMYIKKEIGSHIVFYDGRYFSKCYNTVKNRELLKSRGCILLSKKRINHMLKINNSRFEIGE